MVEPGMEPNDGVSKTEMIVQISVEAGEPVLRFFLALWRAGSDASFLPLRAIWLWWNSRDGRLQAKEEGQPSRPTRNGYMEEAWCLEPEIKEWAVAASAHPDDCKHEKTEGP